MIKKSWISMAVCIALIFSMTAVSAGSLATVTPGAKFSTFEKGGGFAACQFNGSVYSVGGIMNKANQYKPDFCLFKETASAPIVVHKFGKIASYGDGMAVMDGYLYFTICNVVWKMDRKEKITRVYTIPEKEVIMFLAASSGNIYMTITTPGDANDGAWGDPVVLVSVVEYDLKTKVRTQLINEVDTTYSNGAIAVSKDGKTLIFLFDAYRHSVGVMDLENPGIEPIRYNDIYFDALDEAYGEENPWPVWSASFVNNFLVLNVNWGIVGFDDQADPIQLVDDPMKPVSQLKRLCTTTLCVGEDGNLYGYRYWPANGINYTGLIKITIPKEYKTIRTQQPILDLGDESLFPD